MTGGTRQVFISYSRSDAERVDALAEGLRQLRYDAWMDEELTGGQAWWDTVLSQIRASGAVLVALSPAALESIAVRREYEYAHAVGRSLLPVVVDRVQLETLPSLLAPLQVVDYCQPDTKSAFALAAALAVLPTPRGLPQPLPEPPPIPISYLSGLMERSQAATLSMDDQLALVARLKDALGRASERKAAEEVLRSLQDRNDLYQVSAREIESLLPPFNRQAPTSQDQESLNARLRDSSARKWSVNQIVGTPKSLRLELRKYDRHILEYRYTNWSDTVTLDGKKVAGFMVGGTKTFEFEDDGEKVIAEITLKMDLKGEGGIKSFKFKLDNELVYQFP
jgi:hypothetical protein